MHFALERGSQALYGWTLTKPLGSGGFGEVWEARGQDGKIVALKFLPCGSRYGRVVVNEVRQLVLLREIKHPHLLELYSVVTLTGWLVLVMERADGSLQDLQRLYREESSQNVAPRHLCELLTQAAVALDFLAGLKLPSGNGSPSGMQHCDVKPANLLLVGDILKVADFGLSTARMDSGCGRRGFGTPGYAPPEFAEGRVTPRSDQYMLAATYYQLRTGRLPFDVEHRPGQPAPANLDGVSLAEQAVLARALRPDWLARWPSCTALMRALTDAVARESAAGEPRPDPAAFLRGRGVSP